MRDLGHELILLNFFDLVGGMTVFACRKLFFLIRPGYMVDAVCVFVINAFVAGCASRWKIFVIGRRTFVIMFEFKVGGVAVCADRAGK